VAQLYLAGEPEARLLNPSGIFREAVRSFVLMSKGVLWSTRQDLALRLQYLKHRLPLALVFP
jgi:hypothetical protein